MKRKNLTKKNGYKSKKSIKNKGRKSKKNMRGGSDEKCVMCNKKIVGNKFIPSDCLMKYGKLRAHKICENCWWNKFALEGKSHKCPGCEKNLPLNDKSYTNTIVDLTK